MGRIVTSVSIVNALDPAREVRCDVLVDTGAWGLMLPRAWRDRLGSLPLAQPVELVTADQRLIGGEVCGPVIVQIEGFRPISSEVTFVDMAPEDGRIQPLLGYTILEQAGVAVDMVGHRLIAVPHRDMRLAAAAAA